MADVPILTPNDRVRLAVQVLPVVCDRERLNNDSTWSEKQRILDDNNYLASEALNIVDEIEKQVRQTAQSSVKPAKKTVVDRISKLNHSNTVEAPY